MNPLRRYSVKVFAHADDLHGLADSLMQIYGLVRIGETDVKSAGEFASYAAKVVVDQEMDHEKYMREITRKD